MEDETSWLLLTPTSLPCTLPHTHTHLWLLQNCIIIHNFFHESIFSIDPGKAIHMHAILWLLSFHSKLSVICGVSILLVSLVYYRLILKFKLKHFPNYLSFQVFSITWIYQFNFPGVGSPKSFWRVLARICCPSYFTMDWSNFSELKFLLSAFSGSRAGCQHLVIDRLGRGLGMSTLECRQIVRGASSFNRKSHLQLHLMPLSGEHLFVVCAGNQLLHFWWGESSCLDIDCGSR